MLTLSLRPIGQLTAILMAATAIMACAKLPEGKGAAVGHAPIAAPKEGQRQGPINDLDGQCAAPSLQHLIGKPKAAMDSLAIKGPVRFERPGQMVTMDYSPSRTRVSLNAKGIITAIRCG
jgi:hypothetical protein